MRQRSERNKRFIDTEFEKLQQREMLSQWQGNNLYQFPDLQKMEQPLNNTAVPAQKEEEKSYEISFQAKFMSQHQSALQKEGENFMESCLKDKDLVNLGLQAIKSLDFVNFQPRILNANQKSEFTKEIEKQQKLIQFLQLIKKNFSLEIACQLQFAIFWAWKKYLKISDPFISQHQLIKKAQNFSKTDSQKLFAEEGLKFINLDVVHGSQLNEKDQIKMAFKEFIEFLYITVFLIIEGYFENPYLKESRKRIRSAQLTIQTEEDSWCEEINYYPTKKIFYL